MNNTWVKYSIYFIFIVLFQVLIINSIKINVYFYPMVYVLLIIMLPFHFSVLLTMLISLVLGISIDAFSDTFGLHASSSLLIGYLRPTILKFIKPKEGYDTTLLPSIHDMGFPWFLVFSFLLIFVHHLWFFSIEYFSLNSIGLILIKTILSTLSTFLLIFVLQYLIYKPSRG